MQRRIDAELLRNIMRLYTEVDKGEEIETPPKPAPHTITGLLSSTAAYLLSFFIKNIRPKLKAIEEEVLKNIKEDNSAEEWVDLVILLGNKAAEAERLHRSQFVYDKTKQSRLCDILLMIRNELTMELTEVDDDYKAAIDERMQILEAQIAEGNSGIKRANNVNRGHNVAQKKNNNKHLIVDLAYLTYNLSDTDNISQAKECGLNYLLTVDEKNQHLKKEFKKISSLSPKSVHEELPHALQNYRLPGGGALRGAETMYEDRYASRLRMSWDRFLQIHGDFDLKGKNRAAPHNGIILDKLAEPIDLKDDYDGEQKDIPRRPQVDLIKTKEKGKDKTKVSPPAPKNNRGAQNEKMDKARVTKKVMAQPDDEISDSEVSEESAPRARRIK